MKRKLLITMGCSLTEGVGCYDITTIPKKYLNISFDLVPHDSQEIGDVYDLNKDNFHKLGWPNRLGKKLGFDKVLNLGLGGSSTSGQVKSFFDKYPTEIFDDYDVLIIFMLPEPTRLSFYSMNQVLNLLPTHHPLTLEYIKIINNEIHDPSFEQIFYVKVMEEVCKNRNFNFIFFNHNYTIDSFIRNIYESPFHLIQGPHDENPWMYWKDTDKFDYTSPICYHPNDRGYEVIAQTIYENIKKQFPQYIGIPKSEIEWEWNGSLVDNTYKITLNNVI